MAAEPLRTTGELTRGAPCEAIQSAPGGEIEIVGASFATDGERSSRAPIYSLVFGNPRHAELRAYAWTSRFGMYGLDATLWTRERQDSQKRWRRTMLRRPRTLEEVVAFSQAPEAFKDEMVGGLDLLPCAMRDLPDTELAAIDYVVRFGLEGMRVLLKVGVTADEANTLLAGVRRAGERER